MLEDELRKRSDSRCELCSAVESLSVYEVPPDSKATADVSLLLCDTCLKQIENSDEVDINHWRCLNDSMWSQLSVVQVMAWRMLT